MLLVMSTTSTDEFTGECIHGMEPRFCSICRKAAGFKPGTDRHTNDCTVQSFVNITGLDYSAALDHLRSFGRRDGQGMNRDDLRRALADLGVTTTPAHVCEIGTRGTFLISAKRGTKRHSWVVRDGEHLNAGSWDTAPGVRALAFRVTGN
jgi:hypothetical protein